MALLLSQYSGMASDVITPSFVINFLNHKLFFAAFEAANYSASVVESAMMGCLELFQLTAPSLQTNTYDDINFLSSRSDMKSESVYPLARNSESPSKIKNKFLVLLKYFRISSQLSSASRLDSTNICS